MLAQHRQVAAEGAQKRQEDSEFDHCPLGEADARSARSPGSSAAARSFGSGLDALAKPPQPVAVAVHVFLGPIVMGDSLEALNVLDVERRIEALVVADHVANADSVAADKPVRKPQRGAKL